VVYLTVLIYGVLLGLSADQFTIFVMNVFVVAAISIWIRFDARRNDVVIPLGVQLFVYMFWPIAVPIYLIWTRGFWKGLGWAVLNAFGLFVTLMVGYVGIFQFVN
jgi:hypothetical protein